MKRGTSAPAPGDPSAPQLTSLAPAYSDPAHGTYLTVLRRALDEQPEVHNIALSGTYGAGKSSILGKIATLYPQRAIQISLLTLGAKSDSADGGDKDGEKDNPVADTTTNQIQKEIVKQLLYQQSPTHAPESRFRRIARFRHRREAVLASVFGLATLAVIVLTGMDASVLGLNGLGLPAWVRTVTLYAAVVAAGCGLGFGIRMLLQGRLGIEKVTAGPATITLPPRSSSYFDEYLDEIIYFFETNAKRDIVIIEDLDRFNDATIFESLRSLNGLLNAAKQLDGRHIRFIYAVRDSVLENLGRDKENSTGDEVRDELLRANRTKFFELIVPVVPFITHRNARDLMHELLTTRGHTISRGLLDVVARHVADMRLIHNIVNEYEIFKHRLIDVPMPVPELNPDRLFALVVFKNARMADFEAIRLGNSSLDKLYGIWRELAATNLQRLRKENLRLRRRIDEEHATTERAAALGNRIIKVLDTLIQAPGSHLRRDIRYGDAPITDDELRSAPFWRKFVGGNLGLSLNSHDAYGHARRMALSVEAIRILLDDDLDLTTFETGSAAADRTSIEKNKTDIELLGRRTWSGLLERPDLTYALPDKQVARGFREWVEHLTRSRLATDLIVHGHITPYFPLHISSFYGQIVRPAAMTYIMRNVDHGTADPDFPLDSDDVETLLHEQGESVLHERSMYNVSILDHLLANRSDDARIVVGRLASQGTYETEFLAHYLAAGNQKRGLVAQLVQVMPNIFSYLATSPAVEQTERARLIDVAVTHRDEKNVSYEYPVEVREFVESSYLDLASLTQRDHAAAMEKAVRFLVESNAVLPDISSLPEETCVALAKTRAYRVTAENLQRVAATQDISLDSLHAADVTPVVDHALEHITDYLDAIEQSPQTTATITSRALFVKTLKDAQAWTAGDFDRFIGGADPACELAALDDVPNRAWPALVREGRTQATFANVAAYVEWEGEVDKHLTALLVTVDAITDQPDDQAVRQELATALINTDSALLDVEHRIKLALSLEPGVLDTESIEPETGPLIGDLITYGLIADDEEAFSSRLMLDWPTMEHTIRSSAEFESFVGPSTMPAEFVTPLMNSPRISVKAAVLDALDSLGDVGKAAYEAIADAALRGEISLSAAWLKHLYARGVGTRPVMELLAKRATVYTSDELRAVLRTLGEPYSVIADRGNGHRVVPDLDAERVVLGLLEDADVVSSYTKTRGGLRVNLKRARD